MECEKLLHLIEMSTKTCHVYTHKRAQLAAILLITGLNKVVLHALFMVFQPYWTISLSLNRLATRCKNAEQYCQQLWTMWSAKKPKIAQACYTAGSEFWPCTTRVKRTSLFTFDEHFTDQCCVAHIVHSCHQCCSTLLHPIGNLHVRLTFNQGKTNKFFYYS